MRKLNLLPFGFIVAIMVSCSSTKKTTAEVQSIGGKKDAHGCLIGAGQQWSFLKKECIQIFNEGKRLNPIAQKENEAVISAFILFNTDQSKLELFLASTKENPILIKNAEGLYVKDQYAYNPATGKLSISGKESYLLAK